MESNNRWFWGQIGILFLGFLSGLIVVPGHPDFMNPAPLSFIAEVSGFMAFGVIFAVSLNRSTEKWSRLTWSSRPFDRDQPLVFFDFGSYCLLAHGAGSAIKGLLSTPASWSWEIPVSGAVGVWLGVRLCMLIFKSRIESGRSQ